MISNRKSSVSSRSFTGARLDRVSRYLATRQTVPRLSPKSEQCLSASDVALLASREGPPDTSRTDSHLRDCSRCTHLLAETRAFILGSQSRRRSAKHPIRIPITPLVHEDVPLSLAATNATAPVKEWQVRVIDGVRLAVLPTAAGMLLVSVERDGRPVARALVTLVLIGPNRKTRTVLKKRTNHQGEAALGSVKRLAEATLGGQYEVRVTLPASARGNRDA